MLSTTSVISTWKYVNQEFALSFFGLYKSTEAFIHSTVYVVFAVVPMQYYLYTQLFDNRCTQCIHYMGWSYCSYSLCVCLSITYLLHYCGLWLNFWLPPISLSLSLSHSLCSLSHCFLCVPALVHIRTAGIVSLSHFLLQNLLFVKSLPT